MQKPNVKLGSLANKREWHLLEWVYDNRDSCTIDNGNLASVYTKIDDAKGWQSRFEATLDDLVTQGLIAEDEPPLDCFYNITTKGKEFVRYYQSAADLM